MPLSRSRTSPVPKGSWMHWSTPTSPKYPPSLSDLEEYRTWADPLLKASFEQAKEGSTQRLNMALALLPVDESKVNYLRDQLLVATPSQFPVVRDALLPHKDAIVEPLWSVALDSETRNAATFPSGLCLGDVCPRRSSVGSEIANLVAGHLVTLQASDLVAWREALRPAKGQLVAPLTAIYRNPSQDQQQRSFATETLADYAADQPEVLADLVMDADEKQFAVIFPKLQGAWRRGSAVVASRNQEAVARHYRGSERSFGKATGECSGRPLEDEPCCQCLAALEASVPIRGCGVI